VCGDEVETHSQSTKVTHNITTHILLSLIFMN